MSEKIVGVLGGMGPETTAELLVRMTRSTPVRVEQDHLRVILDSNPKIPNRTDALLSGETVPLVEALAHTARNLERAGANVIGMPCNTAHAFLAEVRAAVSVPVLDMIRETAARALEVFGEGARIGILATDGTLKTGLYHQALEEVGLTPMHPSSLGDQVAVMHTTNAVKIDGVSTETALALFDPARRLAGEGAVALVAGCTEISLVLQSHPPELPWLDPLQILAEALVREARGDS